MVNFRWQMLHKQTAVTKELFSQRSPGSAYLVRMSFFFVQLKPCMYLRNRSLCSWLIGVISCLLEHSQLSIALVGTSDCQDNNELFFASDVQINAYEEFRGLSDILGGWCSDKRVSTSSATGLKTGRKLDVGTLKMQALEYSMIAASIVAWYAQMYRRTAAIEYWFQGISKIVPPPFNLLHFYVGVWSSLLWLICTNYFCLIWKVAFLSHLLTKPVERCNGWSV